MSVPSWFRPRGYQHFDVPVGVPYAEAISPSQVASHSWSPLIHYIKEDKRYKPLSGKTVKKARPIMYASHRDACILSCYSNKLVGMLDGWYAQSALNECVVAYRSLSKSNYHFAEQVQRYVQSQNAVTAMCFDVSGFFDNLRHNQLKERLRWILIVRNCRATGMLF
jgi:hypothetical protein